MSVLKYWKIKKDNPNDPRLLGCNTFVELYHILGGGKPNSDKAKKFSESKKR